MNGIPKLRERIMISIQDPRPTIRRPSVLLFLGLLFSVLCSVSMLVVAGWLLSVSDFAGLTTAEETDSSHPIHVWERSSESMEWTSEGSLPLPVWSSKEERRFQRDLRVQLEARQAVERALLAHLEKQPNALKAGIGQRIQLHHDEGIIQHLAFSPNSRFLASVCDNNTVTIWNWTEAKIERVLNAHNDGVATVAFSPDGTLLALGGRDGFVRVWDVTTGKLERSLVAPKKTVTCLAFTPSGRFLACGGATGPDEMVSSNRPLTLWDLRTGKMVNQLPPTGNPVTSCSFHPNGTTLIVTSSGRGLQLVDTASGRTYRHHVNVGDYDLVISNNSVLSPLVVQRGYRFDSLLSLDLRTGKSKELCEISIFDSLGKLSPDGRYLVFQDLARKAFLRTLDSGDVDFDTLRTHLDSSLYTFSPGGLFLAYKNGLCDIEIWLLSEAIASKPNVEVDRPCQEFPMTVPSDR